MVNFTVRVEYENGRDAADKKVFLDIEHGGPFDTWLEEFTDSSGDAEFEIDGDSTTFTVIVDGDRQSREHVTYDGETINITLGHDDEEDSEEES